jgi:tricorn protease
VQTRYPGFDAVADRVGLLQGRTRLQGRPADHDYLKIKEGDFIVGVDGHDLKTSDNYWRYSPSRPATSSIPAVNDKPSKDGAWEVTIAPVGNQANGDLPVRALGRTIAARLVTKLSNGDIGYLHIRAMDAPSLRQFQLDLARTDQEGAGHRSALQRRRRHRSGAARQSSPGGSISTPSAATWASSSRGRRTSTGRWW